MLVALLVSFISFTQPVYASESRAHLRLSEEAHRALGGTRDRVVKIVDRRAGNLQVTVETEDGRDRFLVNTSELSEEIPEYRILSLGDQVSFKYNGITSRGVIVGLFKNGKIRIRFSERGPMPARHYEIWKTSEDIVAHPRCVLLLCVGAKVSFRDNLFRTVKGNITEFALKPLEDLSEGVVVIQSQGGGKVRRYLNYVTVLE